MSSASVGRGPRARGVLGSSGAGVWRAPVDEILSVGGVGWIAWLLAAVLIAYSPVLTSYFLSDDFGMLAFARDPWPSLLAFREAWFRPLGLLFWKASCALIGSSLLWHHLLNLFLHVANSLLVYALTVSLGQNRAAARFSALAFSVFPAHPEAVSWLSGRFDLLCTFFYLWALFLFVLELRRPEPNRRLLALSVCCFLMALLSKEMAFSLVVVAPILLRLLRPQLNWRSRLGKLTPFFLCASAVAAYRLSHAGTEGVYDFQFKVSLSSLRLLWSPLEALFFPWNTRLLSTSLWPVSILFGMVTIFYLLALNRFWEKWRVTAVCALVLYVTVLPLWNLDRVYSGLENSRYYYLPSIVFVVWLGYRVRSRQLPSSFLLMYLLASTGLLFVHNLPWRKAGAVSYRIVSELKKLPTGPKKIEALPEDFLGAYIFRNGMDLLSRSVEGIDGSLCWANEGADQWRGDCVAEAREYRWTGARFLALPSRSTE